MQNVKIGQQIKHKTSGRTVLVHDYTGITALMTIESVAIPEEDLSEWELFEYGNEDAKLLTPSHYNSLQIGNIIRKRTVKEAFLVSAIANKIIFANRYLTVNNFEVEGRVAKGRKSNRLVENEWELVD